VEARRAGRVGLLRCVGLLRSLVQRPDPALRRLRAARRLLLGRPLVHRPCVAARWRRVARLAARRLLGGKVRLVDVLLVPSVDLVPRGDHGGALRVEGPHHAAGEAGPGRGGAGIVVDDLYPVEAELRVNPLVERTGSVDAVRQDVGGQEKALLGCGRPDVGAVEQAVGDAPGVDEVQ
jgi:hypothetical protein